MASCSQSSVSSASPDFSLALSHALSVLGTPNLSLKVAEAGNSGCLHLCLAAYRIWQERVFPDPSLRV